MTKSVTTGNIASVRVIVSFNPTGKIRIEAMLRSDRTLCSSRPTLLPDDIYGDYDDLVAFKTSAMGLKSASELQDQIHLTVGSLRGSDGVSMIKADGLIEVAAGIADCWWTASRKGTISFSMIFEFDGLLTFPSEGGAA